MKQKHHDSQNLFWGSLSYHVSSNNSINTRSQSNKPKSPHRLKQSKKFQNELHQKIKEKLNLSSKQKITYKKKVNL